MTHINLPCDQVKVGHCVIINDVEQPCAKMACVIVGIDGDNVTTKYLNADRVFSSYNKKGCLHHRSQITPIGWFGAEVVCGGGKYHCNKIRESVAKYRDGRPREWQESSPCKHEFRPDVLMYCMNEIVSETGDRR